MMNDKPLDNAQLEVFTEKTMLFLLKGGASPSHTLRVIVSLFKNNNTSTSIDELEKEVLSCQAKLLNQGTIKDPIDLIYDATQKQIEEFSENFNDKHNPQKPRRNFQQEMEDIITFRVKGTVTLADFYTDLNLKTKEEKDSCRKALSRIVDKKILEKVDGGRTGTYRIVKSDIVRTSFIKKGDRDGRKFPILLPFGLSKMCNIHPKSIIIIAGSKSAGKTSILLNIAKNNQRQHEVEYFNSDMGDEEFTDRMTNMGFTCEEDIFFNIYNRSSDFQDLITPERKIFIIDFLEIHDEFYKIGAQIKAIWDKLQNGVAIIGLQMKQGSTLGRGGDFTKEKARLYLSLDYVEALKCTKIRIEEAKSPSAIYSEGVRGWWRHVKIIGGGSKFQAIDNKPLDETGWTGYEEEVAKKTILRSF